MCSMSACLSRSSRSIRPLLSASLLIPCLLLNPVASALADGLEGAQLGLASTGTLAGQAAIVNASFVPLHSSAMLASWDGSGAKPTFSAGHQGAPNQGALNQGVLMKAALISVDASSSSLLVSAGNNAQVPDTNAMTVADQGEGVGLSAPQTLFSSAAIALFFGLTVLAAFNSRKRWPKMINAKAA